MTPERAEDECVGPCAYGTCSKSMADPYGCGGCCACLGGCVVAWEEAGARDYRQARRVSDRATVARALAPDPAAWPF